jgi:adenosylhomocysteine nucleosidase
MLVSFMANIYACIKNLAFSNTVRIGVNMYTKIGFVVAMKEEADILASSLGLERQLISSPSYLKYSNSDGAIIMLTPGVDNSFGLPEKPVARIGKVSAGVITTILVREYHPELIINCGTAGGIKSADAQIGDIIVADFVANHDIHIPLPGYNDYGIRKIKTHSPESLGFLHHPYKIGTVSSGESFTTTEQEWQILRKNNAIAKEMEAAGILQALQILNYDKPYYIIKSITDIVDESILEATNAEQFIKNFTFAMEELTEIIKEILVSERFRS